MKKEDGVSHIAYFRTDGGSPRLYTEEYVNDLEKEIEELKDETEKLTKEWLKSQEKRRKAIEYLEQPFRDNFDFSKATLLEILEGSDK